MGFSILVFYSSPTTADVFRGASKNMNSDVPLSNARSTNGAQEDQVTLTQRFCSFLPPNLIVATCVALASSVVHAQESESSTVLVVLPEARHDVMIAALRVELAGHAGVLEGACPSEGCTLTSLRLAAEAQGADQVMWVTFPQGEIAPAEVRVLRIASTRAREAMLPSAWDVIEPRVMAAVTARFFYAAARRFWWFFFLGVHKRQALPRLDLSQKRFDLTSCRTVKTKDCFAGKFNRSHWSGAIGKCHETSF